MSEKRDENYRGILILFTFASFALVLASSVGVFDGFLSISEKLQSNYRIEIQQSVSRINDFGRAIYDIANVKKERDQYRKQVTDQQSEISELQAELKELNIANIQNNSAFSLQHNLIPTMIIRYKPEDPGVLWINKGSENGAKQGDILIYKNYALGELVQVNKYTSIVRTIKSGDSNILVISSNGTKGVLYARGGRELWVKEILSDATVNVGDSFTTLGINSNFVPNLYVGEVLEIKNTASGTTKEVKLKNDLDFYNLREVYILHHED